MKFIPLFFKSFVVLFLTFIMTKWWLGTAWSERYWTWLNHLLGGQRLGLAADVELVTILMLALAISIGFFYFFTWLLSHLKS